MEESSPHFRHSTLGIDLPRETKISSKNREFAKWGKIAVLE